MGRSASKRFPDSLLNRELSWLDFNARVLELAADGTQLLLERVRFFAIFSSNLDEFFRVRVAGLMDQLESGYAQRLADGRTVGQTLSEIRKRVLELEAAKDPDVIGLKATVYRTNDESPLVPALIDAAEKGKQSVCVVELRARFDERQNIEWSRALERAGAHVVYGFPSMKVHAKATLIVRREGDVLRRYVHVGTGNYHSETAEIYEDLGLFTADPDVAADVADLFNYITGFGKPQRFRKLLVAPFNLRDELIAHIRRVAEAAASGEKARVRIKVNSLTHEAIINELYAASQAGARITLVIRGICCLVPGVKGMSDNIEVRSILGRFLEHSRVFNFETRESSVWLIGSADLMARNLDNRLEVVVPVTDAASRKRLAGIFELLLADTTYWRLGPDGSWRREQPEKDEKPKAAQSALMRSARRRRSVHATASERRG